MDWNVSRARSLSAVLLVLPWVLVASACPLTECECSVCLAGQAVTLSVTDENGTPLTDWLVDATVDGEPVPDMEGCRPENRVTNACSFGAAVGVYQIVVRAPGFEDKETAARVSVPAGQNCCNNPCVPQAQVTVGMRREEG